MRVRTVSDRWKAVRSATSLAVGGRKTAAMQNNRARSLLLKAVSVGALAAVASPVQARSFQPVSDSQVTVECYMAYIYRASAPDEYPLDIPAALVKRYQAAAAPAGRRIQPFFDKAKAQLGGDQAAVVAAHKWLGPVQSSLGSIIPARRRAAFDGIVEKAAQCDRLLDEWGAPKNPAAIP